MINAFRITAATAVIAAAPMSASALSVKFFATDVAAVAALEVVDQGAGDGIAIVGALSAATAVGGYSIEASFSTILNYPAVDAMSGTFTIGSGLAGSSARIEVTHMFDNGIPTPITGEASTAINSAFVGSASLLTEVYIAASAYGKDTLVSTNSVKGTVTTGLATLLASPYYVTQVFTINGANSALGTATAEWVAPVPVPAAGLMLLTALGGMAAMRRKKA